ncbi:MAG TPA: hypothetical protein VK695_11145 [Steroidobacteraceae bacterium]|jgi:hypothetical protein|nr:hypothetical protein [Steroidobacteraceae bacterium]
MLQKENDYPPLEEALRAIQRDDDYIRARYEIHQVVHELYEQLSALTP